MITASQLERLLNCPGSAALPQIRSKGAWANKGIALHSYLEDCSRMSQEEALDRVPEEHRSACEMIPLDNLPTELAAEVALAYDVASGKARELGRGTNRDYSAAGPFEVVGTADVLGVSQDRVYVADYKTGRGYVPPSNENPQLMFLALAACRAYGRSLATVEIIRIDADAGKVWRDGAELDVFDLDPFAGRLRRLHTRVIDMQKRSSAGGVPDVSEGAWCKYCPARAACPAKTALIRRLASGEETRELSQMIGSASPSVVASAYHRLKMAKDMLRSIEGAIYARAQEEPIPLGDGLVLGETTSKGNEKLDGDTVWQVLTEKHGRDVADQAVSRTATKRGIKEALKQAGLKVAPAERDVLDAVRERGGAKRDTRTTVKEYRP